MSCYTDGRNARMVSVLVAKEESYGVLSDFSLATINSLSCKAEITPVINTVDVPYRTGTKAPMADEKVKTTTGGSIVLSGVMDDSCAWLFEAYTGTAATPFILSDTLNPTYEIHRRHTDGTPKDDISKGCVCTDLKFSVSQNGVLMFDATFDTQTPLYEQTTEGTFVAPTLARFQFAGSTITNTYASLSGITSFDVNLSSETLSDDIAYSNSTTKSCNSKLAFSGDASHESVYLSSTPISVADFENEIKMIVTTFTDGAKTLVFILNGKINAELPDPDTGLYKLKVSMILGGDAATEPLTITYT